MSKNKKSLQDLTLLDRFLFAEVMEDPKTFENILSIILGEDISIKGRPQSEHESRTSPLKRQVRLDVWAEDETDAVYNVEAQKENTKNLPHRSRFYQALIDSKLLDPGEVDFSNMKDCYSIIIAPFDLFGRGLYQYTFQMTCAETGQPLEDGATRIFLNTHGKNSEDISPELKELLYYMEHTTEEISCSTSRLQEIKNHVNIVKSSEEIGVKYMQEWEEKILELANHLDTYIPEPERAIDQPFLLPIEDVFSISGRGTVVTGRVERGIIRTGDEVEIVGIKPTTKTTVTGVEMFRKLLDEGRAGENIGALLRGTKREEIERGQVLAKPGSITPHTDFESEVYVLSKDEGGRHTPFFKGYRPQFYFRTTDVTGTIELPEGVEMVMPGDNIKMTVSLIHPIAMDQGLRFAIREGGRTVGAGVVAKIIK